jgi:CubicO group peptidase (beta-lactamase class C family)
VLGLLRHTDLAQTPTSVAVTRGGETLWWQAGQLPGSDSVTASSVFYAASVTKQLTATLVAMTIDTGLLGYDDPVTEVLPDLPAWMSPRRTGSGVRIRHLLHHTSELPEVTSPLVAGLDNTVVLERLRRHPAPETPPGRRFGYSNTGYVVLAGAVEAVLAQPFATLVDTRIFRPLGLSGSRLGGPAPVLLPDEPPPPLTVGDGGWWTSAVDLTAWLRALNGAASDDGVLGAELVERLETPGRLDDGTPLDYAWGMRATQSGGRRTLTHGGSWPGWLAKTVRQPDQEIAVCVLSASSDETCVSELGVALAAAVR